MKQTDRQTYEWKDRGIAIIGGGVITSEIIACYVGSHFAAV